MLRSQDGGRTWRYERIGRKQALFSVQPLPTPRDRGRREGPHARLRRRRHQLGPSSAGFPTIFTFMRDIGFDPDGRVGYIVGQQGKVLRREDGGKTWSQVLPPPEPDARSAADGAS